MISFVSAGWLSRDTMLTDDCDDSDKLGPKNEFTVSGRSLLHGSLGDMDTITTLTIR